LIDGIDRNYSSAPQQLVHREAIEIMGTELRHSLKMEGSMVLVGYCEANKL